MLDFQVAEDVAIIKDLLARIKKTGRPRPWRA